MLSSILSISTFSQETELGKADRWDNCSQACLGMAYVQFRTPQR